MSTNSRKDDMIGAIAVIVLLIGAASGNAYAMMGIAVAALMLIAIFNREKMGTGATLVTLVGAVTALIIGLVMALR